MKKLFLTLITIHLSLFTLHAQTWLWGREGSSESDTWGVAADNNGNAFLTGYFYDSITFNGKEMASPRYDAFLVKFDSNGNVLWQKQSIAYTMTGGCGSINVTADAGGNSFICGNFLDTANFGSVKLYTVALIGSSFLTKYDAAGNVLWAKSSQPLNGGYGGAIGYSVATDAAGNVFMSGEFSDSISFGTVKLRNTVQALLVPFLVKYDANGNVLWAQGSTTVGANGNANAVGVATDAAGNVYITGTFSDTISFGTHKMYSWDGGSAFLVKYSANGSLLWARQNDEDSAACNSNAVVTDNKANVYITGIYEDTVSFGGDTILNGSNGGGDIFIAKYDSSGKVIWVKTSTHSIPMLYGGWYGYGLAKDNNGHIYFSAGAYPDGANVNFIYNKDTFAMNNVIDPSILLKLDTAGHLVKGTIIRTAGDDNNGIASDPTGKYVYLGGDLDDTITFNKNFMIGGELPFVARWGWPPQSSQGIDELQSASTSVRLYPNPNNGAFTIETKNEELRSKGTIEVYNMLGEKVYAAPLNPPVMGTSVTTISLPNGEGQGGAACGIYLYRVISESGDLIGIGKFIISK